MNQTSDKNSVSRSTFEKWAFAGDFTVEADCFLYRYFPGIQFITDYRNYRTGRAIDYQVRLYVPLKEKGF